MCLVEGLNEKLKTISTDLQGIKCDILLINNHESLAGKAADLEEASFKQRIAIKHLLKNITQVYSKYGNRTEWSEPSQNQCSHIQWKGSKLEDLLGTI